ncbi:unnamed protein product, partial [marine sediment metagenome]
YIYYNYSKLKSQRFRIQMSNNKREEGGLFFEGRTESIYKVIVIGDPSVW